MVHGCMITGSYLDLNTVYSFDACITLLGFRQCRSAIAYLSVQTHGMSFREGVSCACVLATLYEKDSCVACEYSRPIMNTFAETKMSSLYKAGILKFIYIG